MSDDDNPWVDMDREELVDRLATITQMHVMTNWRLNGVNCRLCKEPYPCSTRTVATGGVA